MSQWPVISAGRLMERLEPPTGKIRMVLDTDTYNEIDDQFALVQTLLSPERLQLEAVYAAPFFNERSSSPEEGMNLSYEEILRVLERLGHGWEGPVFRGSRVYLPDGNTPVNSEAAQDLVRRAMAASPSEEPLYVVAIGAITNVASAILLEPAIIHRIVVVWLGGNVMEWPTQREFNLSQDVPAAKTVFDSGAPVVLVPCMGAASGLITTEPEMARYVKGCGAIGEFLYERFRDFAKDGYAYSKVLWDMGPIAYLLDPKNVPTQLVHSPVLSEEQTWGIDRTRHFIRCAYGVRRDHIFGYFFRKLERHASENI